MSAIDTFDCTEFFWSVFSRIWAEYRDLRSKSPYLRQTWENTEQKNLRIWTLFVWQRPSCNVLSLSNYTLKNKICKLLLRFDVYKSTIGAIFLKCLYN